MEVGRKAQAGKTRGPRESRRISFDLKTSKGRALDSFFWYEYGDEEVSYWVYAVVPCDVNKDGRVDLVFYSGDDTSDVTITLLNTGKGFKVHSRKTSVVE